MTTKFVGIRYIGPGATVGEAVAQGARQLHANQRANHRGGATRRGWSAGSRVADGRRGARRHTASSAVHTAQRNAARFSSFRRQLRDAHDVGKGAAEMRRQSTYVRHCC